MEEEFEQLNKKHITDEITGKPFDFDSFDETEDEEQMKQEPENQPPHPLVGVMDMMISSSVVPLQSHGYPAPNGSIWEEWGKPNLSKAFYEYLPMDSAAGAAVASPAFAGVLGLGALVIAFLPCIMHHIEVKKAQRAEEEKKLKEELAFIQQSEEEPEFENPVVEAKRTVSTAPISRGDNSLGWDRVHEILASQQA